MRAMIDEDQDCPEDTWNWILPKLESEAETWLPSPQESASGKASQGAQLKQICKPEKIPP